MSFLNTILRALFDLLLLPFREVSQWISLALLSGVFAVLALLVWKHLSNQAAIDRVKRRIAASFFEIRLFNDDLRAIFRAQWDLIRNNFIYMGLNLIPLAWMLVPMLLVMAQLQFHYGYQGLDVGRPVVLTADLTEAATANGDQRPLLEIRTPVGVSVVTPGVWIPSKRQMAWRVVGEKPGRYEVQLALGSEILSKSLVVSDSLERRSPVRLLRGFSNQLLYPAEEPIPEQSAFVSVSLAYQEAGLSLMGFEVHWIIAMLALSMVIALLLRKRFGVTF